MTPFVPHTKNTLQMRVNPCVILAQHDIFKSIFYDQVSFYYPKKTVPQNQGAFKFQLHVYLCYLVADAEPQGHGFYP